MSNVDIVTTFIGAWSRLDLVAIQQFVSDDIFYQNIPFAAVEKQGDLEIFSDCVGAMVKAGVEGLPITPIMGRGAFVKFLDTVKQFDWADWQVKKIAGDGETVFTVRVDIFGFRGGGRVAVNVIGIFEVRNNLIHAWRDYFSLAEFQSQLGV